MQKYKRIIAVCLLFLLILSLGSCKKEKLIMETYGSESELLPEVFYGNPDFVVKATAESIEKEYFTNPDGDFNQNAHVTVFNLSVSEVYKGTWTEDTMQIKMFNGEGLSVDLYLYGEDENYILGEKVEPFLLETGKEYVLGITFLDPEKYNCYTDPGGYAILYGKTWTFVQNEEGLYENLDPGVNHKELDLATLKANIAAVQQ